MVYLLICFFQTYNIYLILFISYFCLLKRLLKGNKYFEGIKHSLEHWRVDTKVFLFMSLFISLLTLKAPRKTASENVVCLCRLLNIIAAFSNLFLHTGKQCGP